MDDNFKKGITFVTSLIRDNNNAIEEKVKEIYHKKEKEAINSFRKGVLCGIATYAKGVEYIENNPKATNGNIVDAIKEIEENYGKEFVELFLQGIAAKKVINEDIHYKRK